MSVISHTVVVHKAAIASREYPCHGFFVIETYRAIAQDGSVVGISPAMFNSFEGDSLSCLVLGFVLSSRSPLQ